MKASRTGELALSDPRVVFLGNSGEGGLADLLVIGHGGHMSTPRPWKARWGEPRQRVIRRARAGAAMARAAGGLVLLAAMLVAAPAQAATMSADSSPEVVSSAAGDVTYRVTVRAD